MSYQFQPIHIPGKKHVVPDAFSRRSDSPITFLEKLPIQPPVSSNVLPEYENSFGPPSWIAQPAVKSISLEQDVEELYTAQSMSALAAIASTDPGAGQAALTWPYIEQICAERQEYKQLYDAVITGKKDLPPNLQQYKKLLSEFTTLGPVVMLQKRAVIPTQARSEVLQHLHSCPSFTVSLLAWLS